ncbi:MAG: DUF4321 domain-containing protein [Clostridia bacterium]|nr:DUF4321 domain-containing protein [Clostridia bacterium]
MKNSLIILFFVCAGIVFGSLVASLTSSIKGLSWLSYGLAFGVTKPFILDLSVLKLTLGLTFNLNISVILFVTLAIVLAYWITNRRGRRR